MIFYELVRRLGRRAGIEISRYRPFAARRMQLLRVNSISTVIDVGANIGGYGSELRAFGYTGQIISLEPLASAFAELSRRAEPDPNWQCLNIAAGERNGNTIINVASQSVSSSLLPMRAEHRLGAPATFYTGQERICLRRLDSLDLAVTSPTMLKVDTQGYEDHVIAGAPLILSTVAILECELSLAHLYEGQPSFRSMIDRASDLGFELVDIDPFFRDRATGRVLSMDAIFVRNHRDPLRDAG
jgi:FkbM family methyltransferase